MGQGVRNLYTATQDPSDRLIASEPEPDDERTLSSREACARNK
jgi:hypothetical protein